MKTIKLLLEEYKLVDMPDTYNRELFGRIDDTLKIIYLNKTMDDNTRTETLLHEVIHYLDNFFELGLTERGVSQLAKSLHRIIKVNNMYDNKEE